MKSGLGRRLAQLESRVGTAPRHGTEADDLLAHRRRAELLLRVDVFHEGAVRTLAEIDAGTYRLPEPLPLDNDARAAEVKRRYLVAMGLNG